MDKELLPDFLLAMSFLAVLFWMMVTVEVTLKKTEPTHQPECQDIYQLTTKEVLSCE